MSNEKDYPEVVENELSILQNELAEVRAQNQRLKEFIVENGLSNDLPSIDFISIEEKICVNGLAHVKSLIDSLSHSDKDIKNFEIFHKTLQQIRGRPVKDKKGKPLTKNDVDNLLKLVKD